MMTEVPDYTLPVSIIAQEIATLAVDISAASIGVLDVAISSAPTIDVNIQSSVRLNVNASQTGEWTVNAQQTGDWIINAQQTGTWTINIGAPLDGSGNLKTAIESAVTLNVNISSQSTALNVNITGQTAALDVNIASQDAAINVNISSQSSALNVNISSPVDASGNLKTSIQSSVTLNVNLASQSTTINVNISGQSSTLDVKITGSTVTMNVNITNPSLTVQISGTPTINVQTSGGANIVVDKLTTGYVYAARRSYNDTTGTPTAFTPSSGVYYAKFYPRGMRGYLQRIYFWVDGPRGSNATVYAAIAPDPSAAVVYEYSTTVPAGSDPGWFYVNINRFWPYDSLLIAVKTTDTSVIKFGRDTSSLGSGLYSTDGAKWYLQDYRYYLYPSFYCHNDAVLPIGGTVSAVVVPSTTSSSTWTSKNVPSYSDTAMTTIYGSGRMISAELDFSTTTAPSSSVSYGIKIEADGNVVVHETNIGLTQSVTATSGRSPVGVFYQTGAVTVIKIYANVPFKRTLKVYAYQSTGSTVQADGFVSVEKIGV